jgi:alpha-L-arabinofuranosidase
LDRVVIDGLVDLVDLHSLHLYTGSSDYWTNVLSPHQAERAIAYTSTFLAQAAYNKHVATVPRITYDEWNVWYRTDDGALEERYDFDDALAVATYLNIFIRHCDWVKMANLAQMVNAIAPVVTTGIGAGVQPIYHSFLLQSTAALDEAVDVAVTAPVVPAPAPPPGDRWGHRLADLGPFCVVDAAATCDRGRRRVSLTIVNRERDGAVPAEVRLRGAVFDGEARIRVMTGAGTRATGAGPPLGQVNIEDGSELLKGDRVTLELPPRSFTVLEAPIEMEP